MGLCKELGWVPNAAPIHIAQPKQEEEGDIDWDAPDDLSPRSAGAGGMANAVSVLQQEEEAPLDLNTLHGVVLAGDLERLKAMEKGEIDLNALDEYVNQLGTVKNAVLIPMWYPFVGLHTSPPRGGSGTYRACSGAPAGRCRSGCSGT